MQQQGKGGGHLFFRHAGKAHQQAAAVVGQHVVTRQRPHQHAACAGGGGDRHVVGFVRQVQDQVQPGVVVEFAQRLLAQMLLNQRGQKRPPPGIQQPHAANMRGVVAFLNKLRQRGLDQQVTAAIEFGVRGFQRRHQGFWQHHVTQPQRRVQRLAEGADINHRRIGFQPLQRRDGLPGKAELAVVVIFDNPTAAVARQCQQPLPPRQTHHRSQRILVRGGDENQPWRAGWLLRRHHAGLIDPQRADIHVVHPQNIADPPIARFFNPRVVARIAQHARHQIYRLMNAFGNQNLLRRAAHRARHAQIVHQCMLQLRAAALIAVGQPLWDRAAADARLDLAEQLVRKGVDVGYAGDKRPPLFGAGAGVMQQGGTPRRQLNAPLFSVTACGGADGR
ncbi:hypothetical protein ALQ63_04131 [Serratia plymuthica]|nr:hypothetical protein ALQ63_04131 [Serratia plymuthica]